MPTILIIEEDEILRRTLELILSRDGYKVLDTGFGDVGVKLAVSEKPDLILVGVKLPVIGGFEVCRFIRNTGIQTPIIMLSSHVEPNHNQLMMDSGFNASIMKPFGMQELKEKVGHYLQ